VFVYKAQGWAFISDRPVAIYEVQDGVGRLVAPEGEPDQEGEE